jgi:hypothetical protein
MWVALGVVERDALFALVGGDVGLAGVGVGRGGGVGGHDRIIMRDGRREASSKP